MSAAQALTSGPVPSPSNPRPSSGGSGVERRDTSFRDALETASRSGDAPDGARERLSPDRAREGKSDRDGASKDDRGDASRGDANAFRAEPATAAELSAILATLGAGLDGNGAGGGFVAEGEAGAQSVSAAPPDTTAWHLPGAEGGGETLDAPRLLALLKAGALNPTDLPAEALTIKVTVAGQETHLALDKVSADALSALSAAQDAAAPADGKSGAALGAALSQSADDAVRSTRQRDAGGPGPEQRSEPGATRGATTADIWSGRSGTSAFADQGIAGQEGRQPDGRGSSGANSQQQGSGAFAAGLAAGNLQATGAVGMAQDVAGAAEPVSEQIAQHVRAELKAGGPGEASSEGMVKVLNLELKPANMGSVTVRLALKDNAITVHIEAQRAETLAVIERERGALTDALASAGYDVDGITAAAQGDAGRSMGGSFGGLGNSGSSPSPGGSLAQGQGLPTSSGGQGQGGSAQAGSGHSAYRHPSDDKDTNGGGVRRGEEGLYV
ncbi:MAG: flagellar hook-length control protein FliK [Rhizobiales bacterium]|nr:flagellar hook-length control protein FliK [Hyphomicrobiales bacterium]